MMKRTIQARLALCSIATTALLLGALTMPARADIIVVAPTATTPGSLHITLPINFTLSAGLGAGLPTSFVLDEWVISDGGQTASTISPAPQVSVNGGAPVSYSNSFIRDNWATTAFNNLTPNDGVLGGSVPFALAANDVVTLLPGTYSIAAAAGFNPQATQDFTGNMFFADPSGTRISNTVSAAGVAAVPEPSTYATMLGGLGLLAGVQRFRRTRKA